MGAGALSHFVERAADKHLARFEEWFPSTFDWVKLCSDVPAMAARTGRLPTSNRDLRDLEDRAGIVFRGAHLITLAVYCAVMDEGDEADPDALILDLTLRPMDEEEDEFSRLAGEHLEKAEEALAGEDAKDPEVARAAAMVAAAWPAISRLLTDDETGILAPDAPDQDLLWSIARIGAILAAFRWMAAETCRPEWPQLSTVD